MALVHFNPRSPHGERLLENAKKELAKKFQSTLPARGATSGVGDPLFNWRISIHAPRTGSDYHARKAALLTYAFQSTLPARGATLRVPSFLLTQPFQSTLPARGATLQRQHIAAGIPHFNPRSPHGERPCSARRCGLLRPISIHAPRTGSDGICIVFSFRQYGRISIHAPRTGSDAIVWNSCVSMAISIHAPRTGSDFVRREDACSTSDFNPRSPHGERRDLGRKSGRNQAFQSTLPARGAT